jgi:tail-anchored protein insertion receptor
VPIREQIGLQKSAQNELLKTSASLKSTSSQDEFAKWARLNRQHDKQIQDLQKLTTVVDGHKAKFKKGAGMLIWVGTTGVKGVVQWWYSKQPVFWLPAGAFPAWMEYVLAFPKAPRG